MTWIIKQIKKMQGKNPIMIEGLPGMGNVGKVALDFMIDNLGAEKIMQIYSYNFPHFVFVNEENMVELPSIEIYAKRIKDKTLMLVSGDIQPIDETSCYEFCNKLLDIFEKNQGTEIITLGGIGLNQIPKNPSLYCTGNDKTIIKKYSSKYMNNNLNGMVGPIIGVSGLLVGLAKLRKIPAVTVLAETYNNPSYIGIKGARKILSALNKQLNLGLKLNQLDTEINRIDLKTNPKMKRLPFKKKKLDQGDVNYIG